MWCVSSIAGDCTSARMLSADGEVRKYLQVWPESNVPPVRPNCCSSPARVRSSTAAAHRTCTTGARSKLKRSTAYAAAASSRAAHATATAYLDGLAFAIVSNQIRRRRLRSQLPQHRHHLSAMVGAVIHGVLEGMRGRLRLAGAVAQVFEGLVHADLAEPLQGRPDLRLVRIPRAPYRGDVGKGLRVRKRGRRLALPSRAPDPIRTIEMRKRVADGWKAVAQILCKLLGSKRLDRIQDAPGRPVVELDQNLEIGMGHERYCSIDQEAI